LPQPLDPNSQGERESIRPKTWPWRSRWGVDQVSAAWLRTGRR